MSKIWYPVIDYEKCIDCGSCLEKCPHGVYDKATTSPKVVLPEKCVQGCHGCGNLCPVGAIKYAGDDTGWTPLKGKVKSDCDCSGGNCGGGCCG